MNYKQNPTLSKWSTFPHGLIRWIILKDLWNDSVLTFHFLCKFSSLARGKPGKRKSFCCYCCRFWQTKRTKSIFKKVNLKIVDHCKIYSLSHFVEYFTWCRVFNDVELRTLFVTLSHHMDPFIIHMIYTESCFMYNFMHFVYIYLIYLLYEMLIFLIISVYFAHEVGL